MLDTYRVSDSWKEKGIYIPKVEDNLSQDVIDSLLSFKIHCVDDRIADNAHRFRTVANEEDMMMLLAEKKNLIDLRQQLGRALNRVIS